MRKAKSDAGWGVLNQMLKIGCCQMPKKGKAKSDAGGGGAKSDAKRERLNQMPWEVLNQMLKKGVKSDIRSLLLCAV